VRLSRERGDPVQAPALIREMQGLLHVVVTSSSVYRYMIDTAGRLCVMAPFGTPVEDVFHVRILLSRDRCEEARPAPAAGSARRES